MQRGLHTKIDGKITEQTCRKLVLKLIENMTKGIFFGNAARNPIGSMRAKRKDESTEPCIIIQKMMEIEKETRHTHENRQDNIRKHNLKNVENQQ